MQTSSLLADLAQLARLSVPSLSEQQAETRAAAAFLLLVGHPSPAEVPDIRLDRYLEGLHILLPTEENGKPVEWNL